MALGVTRHDWRARGPLDACHQLPPHQQHSNTSGQGQNWIQVGCSMLERMNGLLPRGRCFAGTHCYTWRSAQPFGHGAMVIHMLQRKHDSCKHNHRWMPCKGCQNLHHATNNYREGPEHHSLECPAHKPHLLPPQASCSQVHHSCYDVQIDVTGASCRSAHQWIGPMSRDDEVEGGGRDRAADAKHPPLPLARHNSYLVKQATAYVPLTVVSQRCPASPPGMGDLHAPAQATQLGRDARQQNLPACPRKWQQPHAVL